MLALFEQAALHDYPNPERIGCPGPDFLKRLATDRKSIPASDPRLRHVARCSPCFREFVEYRDAARRKLVTRRAVLGIAGTAAAAGIAAIAVRFLNAPNSNSDAYEHVEIDLSNAGTFRGSEPNAEASAPQASLPRKRLDLEIILPFASAEGNYEVQVLHQDGKPTGLRASGTAHLVGGKTILPIRIDLTSLPADRYQIGIRRIPFDWMPIPIRIH